MTISSKISIDNATNCCFSITSKSSLSEENERFLKLTTEYSYSEPGNITPNIWFSKIVDEKGRPDLTAITILSEIFALYRFSNSLDPCAYTTKRSCEQTTLIGKTLRTSYEHFFQKFFIRKDKTRRALLRLEELGIIERDVCNIAIDTGKRCNKLMITINQKFFLSCFRDPELDIRTEKNSKKPSGVSKIKDVSNKVTQNKNSFSNEIQSMQISYHHISNKNYNKRNRSIETPSLRTKISQTSSDIKSNFLKNNLFLKQEALAPQPSKQPKYVKPKELKDFYPLSKEDCSLLQAASGRDFSLRAMNEILLDMSKRLTDRVFQNKKAFFSYMSKAFAGEMRDAVKISNESFRIRSNQTEEGIILKQQENFLTEIENSLEVSPEWHLKKKLASVFDTNKSYELLRSYRRIAQDGSVFTIYFDKHVELTKAEHEIILKQVKATHEVIDLGSEEITIIENLEIKMPEKSAFEGKESRVTNKREQTLTESIPDTIWGRVRKSLILSIYTNGEAIDRNWFSKLEAEVNEDSKTIHLKAPSSFIKDFICSHYLALIERISKSEEYRVTFA